MPGEIFLWQRRDREEALPTQQCWGRLLLLDCHVGVALAPPPRNDGLLRAVWNEGRSGAQGVKQPAVYIMANRRNGTLYTGVTSNLPQRAHSHRQGLLAGFTKRYGCKLLVYYEFFEDMPMAIAREKQIKSGSRKDKVALIEFINPTWRDLYADFA
jgi:putative endonuclease